MDSDSDLQAYINELSRKTHDLQYGDIESSSSNEPEAPHSSDIEIAVKKPVHGTDAEKTEKQIAQTNKVKELEEKYLKRAFKSTDLNLSSSFSEYNLEFEEDKLHTDNIHSHTLQDEMTLDSSAKPNENNKIIKPSLIQETLDSVDDRNSTRQIEYLKPHSIEEDSSLASRNNSQRKLSDNSLLLNKSGIFYPTNEKPGKQKSAGKIIFRMRSSTLSESDTIKSEVTSSVSEEIPELMQKNELEENAKSARITKEDNDESHNYEENTFENSEESSTINTKSKSSKLSVSSQKSSSKSATKSTVSEQSSEEEEDDNSGTVMSLKGHSSISPTEDSDENNSSAVEKSDSISQDDSSQNTSLKSQEDRSFSNESLRTDRESNTSLAQNNRQKVKKGRHKTKSKTEDETYQSSSKSDKTRVKDKKEQRKINTNKKILKVKQDESSTSSSSLVTSVLTSSTSSFHVKMKKKKYREKKRKLKQEKELTELIIKLLIKNLPMILRQTIGHNSTAELVHQQPRTYVCHHCGGNSDGFERTQNRIDDALRQTVGLTKQFLESQKTMMETQYSHLNSSYRYTTLKNYST